MKGSTWEAAWTRDPTPTPEPEWTLVPPEIEGESLYSHDGVRLYSHDDPRVRPRYVPAGPQPKPPSALQQRAKAARKEIRSGDVDPLDALASVIWRKRS
jgi:hypothetical protein